MVDFLIHYCYHAESGAVRISVLSEDVLIADPFREKFVRAFPPQFLQMLVLRQRSLYEQAIAMAFDSAWAWPEAASVLPCMLRALWEAEVRAIAVGVGLRAVDRKHTAENCGYVMIDAGGLTLTVHRVASPHEFVRDAESRKENAAVNRFACCYYTDERLLTAPLPQPGSTPVYLNLLHGGHMARSVEGKMSVSPESLFLRVAIPDPLTRTYVRNWSAQELLSSYAVTPLGAPAAQLMEDRAVPRKRAAEPRVKTQSAGANE